MQEAEMAVRGEARRDLERCARVHVRARKRALVSAETLHHGSTPGGQIRDGI